ncbi:MAG: hypothetical protein LRY55_07365 [Leadbetterella sp.]|nr:hypothetical protein [Leadbetterella sp.]
MFRDSAREDINIRKVRISEVEQLQKIARATFYDTFSAVNSKENMDKYLEEKLSIEILASELDNEHSEFYFAEAGSEVVGYLK